MRLAVLNSIFYLVIYRVDCFFLSLLNQLDMKNPIILIPTSALGSNEMLALMKNIIRLDQSISITTSNITSISIFEKSPGIFIEADDYTIDHFFGRNRNSRISKPWVFVGNPTSNYCGIDEPIYYMNNGSLFEQYKFKSLKKRNELGRVNGKSFQWNKGVPKNIWERRGNFEDLTIIAMTDTYGDCNFFPNDSENFTMNSMNTSNIVPDTFEVII